MPNDSGPKTVGTDYHPNLPRIFFSQVGNQKLRTAIWKGQDKGDGKRTPLLFFNGIGANLEIAQAFADTFTGRDIITFDMPGVGGSPDPIFPYRPWWVAKAAKQILLENRYTKVDVLGVSWGGGPAQQFAWQYSKMVRNLVLCATTTGVTMIPGNPKALSKMASPKRYIDRDFLAKNFEALYGDAAKDGVRDFSINMDKDHIVPVGNGHILNYALKNSRLKIIKDAGHLFLLTRRDESVQLIRDFFGEPEVPMPHFDPVLLPSVAAAYNHKGEESPIPVS